MEALGNLWKANGVWCEETFSKQSKLNGKVIIKGFVRCKEGVRRIDKRDHLYTRHRDEIRTGCHVPFFISLVRETGKYKLYEFVADHNHILHLEETANRMRSHCKISEVQAYEIDLACASGISPKIIHTLMSREAGGKANLGYTELDQKNYIRTRRKRNLIYGEVGSLLMYFQEQINKNPSFHYVV
jgi:zinc finger SWIM domain-containing protein 3